MNKLSEQMEAVIYNRVAEEDRIAVRTQIEFELSSLQTKKEEVNRLWREDNQQWLRLNQKDLNTIIQLQSDLTALRKQARVMAEGILLADRTGKNNAGWVVQTFNKPDREKIFSGINTAQKFLQDNKE